jgi:hypothetical protein
MGIATRRRKVTRKLEASRGTADALGAGLTWKMLSDGVAEAYSVLDTIDATLLKSLDARLSEIVELANLSSILGNILAQGIVNNSGGAFSRAGPHKYQDLRPNAPGGRPVEVKVALENNKPKAHLAKAGYYLAFRYVLGDLEGGYTRGGRGSVIWLWEVRFGHLSVDDFSLSNTPGDSGKTAVVTSAGMQKLRRTYFDGRFCPMANVDRYLQTYG